MCKVPIKNLRLKLYLLKYVILFSSDQEEANKAIMLSLSTSIHHFTAGDSHCNKERIKA